jgi:UDP-3-O-[3-hydroxymyristoyl] glucosamine N-acyltransferase
MAKKTLQEIADFLNARLIGDGETLINDVRGIDEAEPGDLTFIANPKYRSKLGNTRASAVIIEECIEGAPANLLVVKDPYTSLAKVLGFIYPQAQAEPGIHPRAWIESGAEISKSAVICPNVYVGRKAKIGAGTILYPGVFIGESTLIGENSVLYPNVVVQARCVIGNRVILNAGVLIGGDGFGFANPGFENLKIPQVGIVQIDDDVEIGANTTVDRGTLGKTWIKSGVKIDNLVQIAHNVVIGENSIIVAQVGISGSTKLGKRVILAGQVGLVGHIEIGDGVMVGAQSGVAENIEPGQLMTGSPAMPHRQWLRVQAIVAKLPELRSTIRSLVKRVEELEKKLVR